MSYFAARPLAKLTAANVPESTAKFTSIDHATATCFNGTACSNTSFTRLTHRRDQMSSTNDHKDHEEEHMHLTTTMCDRLIFAVTALFFGHLAYRLFLAIASTPAPRSVIDIVLLPLVVVFGFVAAGMAALSLWFAWLAIRP